MLAYWRLVNYVDQVSDSGNLLFTMDWFHLANNCGLIICVHSLLRDSVILAEFVIGTCFLASYFIMLIINRCYIKSFCKIILLFSVLTLFLEFHCYRSI